MIPNNQKDTLQPSKAEENLDSALEQLSSIAFSFGELIKFSSAHLRAARGLLDWSRADIKEAAGVSIETIKNIENGIWKPNEVSHAKIVAAFAKNGVDFVSQDGFSKYGLKVGGVMYVTTIDKKPDAKKIP